MIRILFKIMVWVMIVLGLGVTGVWVWSYYWNLMSVWVGKPVVVDGHRLFVLREFIINPGSMTYMRSDTTVYDRQIGDLLKSWRRFTRVDGETGFWAPMKHFEKDTNVLNSTDPEGRIENRYVSWTFPIWTVQAPFAPFMLYGVWQVVGWRRRRARRWLAEGKCVGCGYDLRASPVRCPECGREREGV